MSCKPYSIVMHARALITTILLIALACATEPAFAAKAWRVKENCTLIPNEANDGDSFHIRIGRRHYVLRHLWVDAPETDNRFPDRVAEQAAYFGITPEDAIKVGKEAARFSKAFLSQQPFTVYTQFADALGSSQRDRDYAIIKVGDTYLMDALVSNGLARIHGLQKVPPDGPSESLTRMRLKGLENDAKRNKRGAWAYAGAPANRMERFQQMNRPAEIKAQAVVLTRATAVYSLEDPSRMLGTLGTGTAVTVLRAESQNMARIRFKVRDDQTMEALARISDLGL
ncbi:MAG: thermonuclease family protein [Kiritimatiellae bacterium]|nr:thermonuclease family protein [Kiritimatiellia bacterium]